MRSHVMTAMTKRHHARRTLAVLGPCAAWAVALIVLGIVYVEAPWAQVTLAAGILCGAVTGLGFALRRWIGPLYVVLLLTSVGMIVAAALADPSFVPYGVLALVIVAASAPIALSLDALAVERPEVTGIDSHDVLERILEHSMLSDGAKRLIFREREVGLLRDVIETDIQEGKYNAALTLCHEMAERFGYREEAEAFRERIDEARRAHFEGEVQTALARLDELLVTRNWAAAHGEAARIRRLYGDSHLVHDLDERILRARQEHKEELEQRFLEAAQRDDVEGAMELLKELDRYLDRAEAERLTEVAQGIVAKHRENLGVQFKLAVNDHRWAEAARIGQTIMDEFPNTKMAEEVRSMVDVLRTRATQSALGGSAAP